MDTNYEAIRSLIDILVKKAGYDVDKNYSENELKKTKETITKLENDGELEKNTKKELIANLKIRQASLENNAEVIGKSLLNCFKDKKSYVDVRGKVEFLFNLAKKEDDEKNGQSIVSSIYSKLKDLEVQYAELNTKIENNNYLNLEEKDLDIKMKDYLVNKIDNYQNEISLCEDELKRLKDIKYKEETLKEKLLGYVANVKKDIEALEMLKKSSLDKGITLEVWEKIENIELSIKSKLERVLKTLKKTENLLNSVQEDQNRCNEKKAMLFKEIERSNNKLKHVNDRINENDYLDYASKIRDLNKMELIRIELNELKNKKDVIYVNVDKVKEELVKEWSKGNNGVESENETIDLKPKVVDGDYKPEIEQEKIIKEETIEVKKEIKKEEIVAQVPKEIKTTNKIELDW